VSTSMRLKRFGSKKRPDYRIVVMDRRAKAQGKTLDEVGHYHPLVEGEGQVVLNVEKVQDWLSKGAQPSDTVRRLLNRNGVTISRTAPAKE
jgi:small subunit ribosomal protein S16